MWEEPLSKLTSTQDKLLFPMHNNLKNISESLEILWKKMLNLEALLKGTY